MKSFYALSYLHEDNNDFHHAKWKCAVISQSQLEAFYIVPAILFL